MLLCESGRGSRLDSVSSLHAANKLNDGAMKHTTKPGSADSFMVLIACEFSGAVREAFRSRGFDAYSVDIISALDGSPFHITDRIEKVLEQKRRWDLGIFFPTCRYLTNSGVKHLYECKKCGHAPHTANCKRKNCGCMKCASIR